jgi:hypothetical protein
MKRPLFAVLGGLALVAALALAVPTLSSGAADGRKVLSAAVLTTVVGPYVGSVNPIRGVNGGGLPWRIASGSVDLRADGRLHVEVEGLVFAAGPNEGTNTIPAFRTVSLPSPCIAPIVFVTAPTGAWFAATGL